jgi:hypothetical protein
MLRWLPLLVLTAGCSGSPPQTCVPTQALTDAVRAGRALVRFCDSDGGCTPAQVSAVETSLVCNLGSHLAHGGSDVLDGGAELGCQP